MVLSTGVRDYKIIREVLTGKTNDVYICQSRTEPKAPYKTVWLVRDRKIVRSLMEHMEHCCEECFMQNENAGFVFPYIEERPLRRFYLSSVRGQNDACWQIWLALVEKCMIAEFPAPLVRLMLAQDQVHIAPDGTLWFGFLLDLSEYDDAACEEENVVMCADKILELIRLETQSKKGAGKKELAVRMQARKLLEKKLDRREYREWIQLYRDIRLIGRTDTVGGSVSGRITAAGQERIYRLLSCVCIVMVCMVVFLLLGHMFYGEYSFWKLFGSSLEQIGTESLLQ